MKICLKTIAIGIAFAVAAFLVADVGDVFAVDDLFFELEGNAVQDATPLPEDWETLWNDCGRNGEPISPASSCGGSAVFTGIVLDIEGASEFAGGNKDIQPISMWDGGGPAANDKTDITNAYAAAYYCTQAQEDAGKCTKDDLIVYFGADRGSNNGDAFLGYWFFKGDVAYDPATESFSGAHQTGDVLVILNFPQATNAVPEIRVASWEPDCTKKAQNPVAGADAPNGCVATNLLLKAEGAVCGLGVNDPVCGITNTEDGFTDNSTTVGAFPPYGTVESPWPFISKNLPPDDDPCVVSSSSGYCFPFESFFEGGINLTSLVGDSCFATFMAESRTSSSFTAQQKDFIISDFPLCGVTLSKTCPNDAITGVCSDTITSEVPTTCELEAECSGEATCDTSNPLFVSGDTFLTEFDVVVGKEGPGNIYDVSLTEVTFSTCEIIAEDGTVLASPISLPQNTPVLVIDGVASNLPRTFTLECETTTNVSQNKVEVSASTSDSATEPDLFDEFTYTPGTGECAVSPAPGLSILKECVPAGGDPLQARVAGSDSTPTHLEFLVPFKITVSNTGDEDLDNVTINDTYAGIDNKNIGTLEAGGSAHIELGTYITPLPNTIDGSTGDPIDLALGDLLNGCDISFTNQATAQAAAISGTVFATPSTATCYLCPAECSR